MEDDLAAGPPARPDRRRLVVALAATAVLLPVLVYDRVRVDDRGGTPSSTSAVAASEAAPVPTGARAETGPPKGVSVVTSSTTSSTRPITTTTTTRPAAA